VRHLLAAVAASMIATTATAADLAPAPAEPVAPLIAAYNWTGPYVGLHAGWGWGRENDNQSSLAPPFTTIISDRFNLSGFVGGAHAGYNYQVNQFVLGVEGDVDYTEIKGDHRFTTPTPAGDLHFRSQWQGSARLRAGYAIDNLLLYATGGLAIAEGRLSVYGTDDTNTHVGWTAGGGLEYAFTQNWIGRVEVRYSDFQKKSYKTPQGKVRVDFNETTATAAVSYKF
jgi:outer membrane immunogenic protein